MKINHFIFILYVILFFFKKTSFGQEKNLIDTIFVNTTVNTVIMFPSSVKSVTLDPGSKEYAGIVKGGATVFLRASVENSSPARLYMRYDDKYYNATIAYKKNLKEKEQYIDLTGKNQLPPKVINKDNEIRDVSKSIETQLINKNIDIFKKRKRDKYKSVATIYKNTFILKLSDMIQDNNFLYIRLAFFNKDKNKIYLIEDIEFMYKNTGEERNYKQVFSKVKNQIKKIMPGLKSDIISVIPKYNLTNKWVLSVTIREEGGIRNLSVNIPYEYVKKSEYFNQ